MGLLLKIFKAFLVVIGIIIIILIFVTGFSCTVIPYDKDGDLKKFYKEPIYKVPDKEYVPVYTKPVKIDDNGVIELQFKITINKKQKDGK